MYVYLCSQALTPPLKTVPLLLPKSKLWLSRRPSREDASQALKTVTKGLQRDKKILRLCSERSLLKPVHLQALPFCKNLGLGECHYFSCSLYLCFFHAYYCMLFTGIEEKFFNLRPVQWYYCWVSILHLWCQWQSSSLCACAKSPDLKISMNTDFYGSKESVFSPCTQAKVRVSTRTCLRCPHGTIRTLCFSLCSVVGRCFVVGGPKCAVNMNRARAKRAAISSGFFAVSC